MIAAGHTLEGGGHLVARSGRAASGAGYVSRIRRRRHPLSQGELALFYPNLADHLILLAAYSCQEGASPLVDAVSGKSLVQNQALLYARPGDPLGRAAVEFDTSSANEFTASSDAAFFDLPSDAGRSLIVRFKMPDNGGVVRGIAGTSSVNSAARWGLRTTAGGVLVAIASDATTAVQANSVAICDDGLWHDALFVWDRTAGTPALRVGLDGAAFVSTSLGVLSAADVPTGLRVGSIHTFPPVIGQQVSYLAWLAGALTEADFAAWRASV